MSSKTPVRNVTTFSLNSCPAAQIGPRPPFKCSECTWRLRSSRMDATCAPASSVRTLSISSCFRCASSSICTVVSSEDSSWLRRILRQLVQQRPRHLYSHAFGTHPLSCWGPCFLSWNFGQLVMSVFRLFCQPSPFLKRLVWHEVSVNSPAGMIMLSDVRFPFILSTVPFLKRLVWYEVSVNSPASAWDPFRAQQCTLLGKS